MNLMPYSVRFYCDRRPWEMGSIGVYIRSVKPGLNMVEPEPAIALPLTFRTLTRDEQDVGIQMEPTMVIHAEAAQMLMDELWRVGLRPTEGVGSAGSLAATERHLQDMRALVFKTEPKTVAIGGLVGPHSP